LYSGLRDAGEEYEPRWEMKTPIRHPPGNVGFVTVDEIHYVVPSVLDTHNQNGSYVSNNAQRIANIVLVMIRFAKTSLTDSRNLYMFLTQLSTAMNASIGVWSSFCNGWVSTAGAGVLSWPMEIDISGNNALVALNLLPVNTGTTGSDKFFNMAVAEDCIKVRITPTYNTEMTGLFVKMFNLNPEKTYTVNAGASIDVTLAINGVQMLKLHSNIGRSTMNSTFNQVGLTQSNVLWVVNASENANSNSWYYNNGLGASSPFILSSIDEIQLYFTDEWNTKIVTMTDWTVILSFDFKDKEQQKSTSSLKRGRMSKQISNVAETLKNVPYNAVH
jgi:hypothetical protein